nr:MAG TPA: hypothetical protein [Caudoviricetes sp.]
MLLSVFLCCFLWSYYNANFICLQVGIVHKL